MANSVCWGRGGGVQAALVDGASSTLSTNGTQITALSLHKGVGKGGDGVLKLAAKVESRTGDPP